MKAKTYKKKTEHKQTSNFCEQFELIVSNRPNQMYWNKIKLHEAEKMQLQMCHIYLYKYVVYHYPYVSIQIQQKMTDKKKFWNKIRDAQANA